MKSGDDRWTQEFIWNSKVSIYKCEWIEKSRLEIEKETSSIQLQRTWKRVYPILLSNSIKQIQSIPEALLIQRTGHSPRSQSRKLYPISCFQQVFTFLFTLGEKHCSNGLFQSCSEDSKGKMINWLYFSWFLGASHWLIKKTLEACHFSHMILVKRKGIILYLGASFGVPSCGCEFL